MNTFYAIGTLFLINGSIWKLFDEVEKVASAGARKATSEWLLRFSFSDERFKRWPSLFVSVFDAVFGKRAWSWRCYSRSIAASFVLSFLTLLLVGFPTEGGNIPWRLLRQGLLQIVLMVLINIHCDYLSLLETRYLLGIAARSRSTARIVGILVLDFILSNLIFALSFVGYFAMSYVNENLVSLYPEVQYYTASGVEVTGPGILGDDIAIIFYIAAFFTSLWLWLYAISGGAIRLFAKYDSGLQVLKRLLNIEEKPFMSIGAVVIVIVTIVFMATWAVHKL